MKFAIVDESGAPIAGTDDFSEALKISRQSPLAAAVLRTEDKALLAAKAKRKLWTDSPNALADAVASTTLRGMSRSSRGVA